MQKEGYFLSFYNIIVYVRARLVRVKCIKKCIIMNMYKCIKNVY